MSIIPEICLFSLIIALFFAGLMAIIPVIGLKKQQIHLIRTASLYARGQFLFIFIAYFCLTLCFLNNDFSVAYVLANSSRSLPWFYKLCAVWGGHEGSMLLWVLILSGWMIMVTAFSQALDSEFRALVLIVLAYLSIGFILFLLITSNPFLRQFEFLNTDGNDLNPLLQDPGFLLHPPILYMGYVGFSVAFAFALAALWLKRVETTWAKWARPWTLAAWCCLTAGITLGSWWAYRELGWGGWWFWDPVENASFMPWLVGTALLHSLAVSEKRQQFLAWTLLLAITAFSLSLVGTFLVRSGVLTSVHAFAVDPKRGVYILLFLFLVIGGSLLLFSLRAPTLQRHTQPAFVSRESALLLNNVFLTVMMLTVLIGTIYPLFIDSLGLGKLSVGAPYFNSMFTKLIIPLLFLMGLGTHLNWQYDYFLKLVKKLKFLWLFIFIVLILLVWSSLKASAVLGLIFAIWVISSTLFLVKERLKKRGLKSFGQGFLGMVMAHCGVAVTVIGIVISSSYGMQDDVKLAPGDSTVFAGHVIHFLNEMPLQGANYGGIRARFRIDKGNNTRFIYPEKRVYKVGNMAMTDAAIDVTAFRDLYIALGEALDDSAWSVRLYFKPFVRWIWGGGFMILLGGLLALTDRRYYLKNYSLTHVVKGTM